jgi:hypothetical protein
MPRLLDRRTGRRIATMTVLAAVAGIGLSACSTGFGNAAGVSSTPPTTPPTATSSPKAAKGVTGQITAENGSTWTVRNRKGKQFTVTITAATRFGTKKQPSTVQQFAVGNQVRITGPISGTTVRAVRVATPIPRSPTATSPAPTTSPTTAPTTTPTATT